MKLDLLGIIPTLILLLLIGGVIALLLGRIKALKQRFFIKWVLIIISTFSIYLLSVFIIFSIVFKETNIEFDASLWKSKEEIRHQMVDDLIEDKILIGKNKGKVIEAIGKPDSESDDSKQWSFDLGMSGSGLGFKFTTIEITFSNDKVISVKKVEIFD